MYEDYTKYRLHVTLENPDKPDDLVDMSYECEFEENKDTYGNGFYLGMKPTSGKGMMSVYDLRYDKEFHRKRKAEFLIYYAETFFSGKNGAWKLVSATVDYVA